MTLKEFLDTQDEDMMVDLYEKKGDRNIFSASVTVGYLKATIQHGDTRGNNEVIKSDSSIFKHYTGAEEVKLKIYTKPQRERELVLRAYDVLDIKQRLNSLIAELQEETKALANDAGPQFFKDAPDDIAEQIFAMCEPYMSTEMLQRTRDAMGQRKKDAEITHEERE